MCLLGAWYVNTQVGPGIGTIAITAFLGLAWLIAKERIRRRTYAALADPANDEGNFYGGIAGMLALVSLFTIGNTLLSGGLDALRQPAVIAFVIGLVVLPIVAWFFLKSAFEWIIAVGLLLAGALAGLGLNNIFGVGVLGMGIGLVYLGWREHQHWVKQSQPNAGP
jgi:hypothetical protein